MAYTRRQQFAWDDAKDLLNRERHGISFSEAARLFDSGRDYLEVYDEHGSRDEDRFLAIGAIPRGIVIVVWTELDDETIRIISARFASRREVTRYFRTLEGMS
jgi:uncharacterized DUF497 family protein